MKKSYFNRILINFFIGIFSNHRFLRPLSSKIKSLEYKIFCVERDLSTIGGRFTPEAIATSDKTSHTLLSEWTELDKPTDQKRHQLIKYGQVSKENLVNILGIPVSSAEKNSTWLIVRPESIKEFKKIYSDELLQKTIICSGDVDFKNSFSFKYHVGKLNDNELLNVIRDESEKSYSRIPLGFMPITINEIHTREFGSLIIREIISFVVKDKFTFSSEDICEGIFGVWNLLPPKKKSNIASNATKIIKALIKKSYCKEWLYRIQENPPIWKFTIPDDKNKLIFTKIIKKHSPSFLDEFYDDIMQLELFE